MQHMEVCDSVGVQQNLAPTLGHLASNISRARASEAHLPLCMVYLHQVDSLMSFRKRNVGLANPISGVPDVSLRTTSTQSQGVRPSPLDGRPTTSTGTQNLDDLLAGHAGLALGNSLLIEENGTTDTAGALLRFYAAEGLVQGHQVFVVGFGEQWARELPGLTGSNNGENETKAGAEKEKMKIAWRYERLGEYGVGTAGSRGGNALSVLFDTLYIETYRSEKPLRQMRKIQLTRAALPTPIRGPSPPTRNETSSIAASSFSHTFDLTKRLVLTPSQTVSCLSVSMSSSTNPFISVITSLRQSLTASPLTSIHRLIIPNMLSPFLYPPQANDPELLLPFLHSLRALLRTYSARLTAMITLPLSLCPRSTGLVRWIEHLSDGVLELAPFPHNANVEPPTATSSKTGKPEEDSPQGMLKVHKLPVLTEKGGGGGGGDDLAFSLSRKRFTIKAFSLPPVEGDQDAQRGEAEGSKMKMDIEF